MKKIRSKFLKIVDEKHDINFHWPKYDVLYLHSTSQRVHRVRFCCRTCVAPNQM